MSASRPRSFLDPLVIIVASLFTVTLLWPVSAAARSDGNLPAPSTVGPSLGRRPSTAQIHRAALQQAALRTQIARDWRPARLQIPRPGPENQPRPIALDLFVDVTTSVGRVTLDTTNGTVSTRTELTLRARTAVTQLYVYVGSFKAGHTMTVSDSQGQLTSFEAGNGVLDVSLRQALAPGDALVLVVEIAGTPECDSGFHQIITCNVGPGTSFDVGTSWQALPYDVDARQLVYPQSATIDIVAPQAATAIASGIAEGVVQNGDGTSTFTFRNDLKGSFSFAVSDAYETFGLPFGSDHEVRSYLFSTTSKPLGSSWRQRTADIMSFHGARYGDYGPKVINIAEIPDGTGAAFGPMMTVFMPTQTLAVNPDDWSASVTLAHELGHQWFAGHIDIADADSPWLSEGFATFAEMEYTSDQASKEYGFDYRPQYRRGSNLAYVYTVPPSRDLPISSPQLLQAEADVYFTVTYTKGALLVNQLRYLLGGDAPFFAAMKAYRADHAQKGATVASLITSLENATGQSLGMFADNWVYRAGYPTYRIALTRGQDSQSGRYMAAIDVSADRDFAMPLEVLLVTADGHSEKIQLPYSGTTTYRLEIVRDSEIISIRFDPDAQLIGRSEGALTGDVHINGAVDGIDVIYTAMVEGQRVQPELGAFGVFPAWADLQTDGQITEDDLHVVIGAFGSRQGEGD